jgi:hypothetical protein
MRMCRKAYTYMIKIVFKACKTLKIVTKHISHYLLILLVKI